MHAKNQLHLFLLFWDIGKIPNLLFWLLWECLAIISKNNTTSLFEVIFKQKHVYPSPLSWNITQILQTFCSGYFENARLQWPKMIAETCRILWCLSTKQKSTYTLKNPAIWLVKNILGNNSRTRILPNIGFAMESQQIKQFSFCIVFEKTNEDNLKKIQNALFAKIWEKMNFPQKSKFVIF